MDTRYDLIIVGGSAAGASAGVYAARRGLHYLILAKDLGGEVALSGEVENWLGIPKTTGFQLASQFSGHIRGYGEQHIKEGALVASLVRADDAWRVTMEGGEVYSAKAVIVATGAHSRLLGVPGEAQYRLKGVSYCTVCDGPLFAGKRTVTIGGGNSALESALMLADIAASVTVINKNPQFKGEVSLIKKVTEHPKITVVYSAVTTEIVGNGTFATGMKYKNPAGEEVQIDADGIFVHIGQTPNSQMVSADCAKDAFGYIQIGLDGATNLPGLFAAGDVTHTAHKQIIIAAGQGATAALSAVQYINRL